MNPGKYNLSIEQGSSFCTQFQILAGTGDPIDLTPYTISSQLKIAFTDVTSSCRFCCIDS